MLKEKVTIYTPTYNRHAFLKRVLDYYRDTGLKILVSDDTKEPFSEVGSYPNLTYVRSGLPYSQSVMQPGLDHLDTEYVVMCADDLIIPPSAIEECVEFLDANPDYAIAQGYQSSMYYMDEGYELRMQASTAPDFSAELPSDRLLKFMSSDYAVYWGVWRTSAWKALYTDLSLNILNEPRAITTEFMIYHATAMVGKIKRLPIFFSLHEDVPSVDCKLRRKGFSYWDFVSTDIHKDLFEYYVSEGTKLLMKYEDLPEELAESYTRRSFAIKGYVARDHVGRKTLLYRLKRELTSFKNKTFGREAYQERKRFEREEFERINQMRLDAMRPECRETMEQAAEFVYKYPRCRENG